MNNILHDCKHTMLQKDLSVNVYSRSKLDMMSGRRAKGHMLISRSEALSSLQYLQSCDHTGCSSMIGMPECNSKQQRD